MSEFELIETINSTLDIHISSFLAYLTIVSAYLVVAFVVGKRLTRTQFVMVTVLFIFAAGLSTFAIWGTGSRIIYLVGLLRLADTALPINYTANFRNGIVFVCALGIFASFKFMWDIRHSKAD